MDTLNKQLILTGADIISMGEESELLVGGKNYNTAIISNITHVRIPQFRAISAVAFHTVLDTCMINAKLVRSMVDEAYAGIEWASPEVAEDHEFLPHFVRRVALNVREVMAASPTETCLRLRSFINNVVDGFAFSQEGIDQLRKRSVLVQVAILSAPLPTDVDRAVRKAYKAICKDAEENDVPVAVRSSAAGEDSRKKAFAGLQDTYLNMVGEDAVAMAYHWDCASAYNLRSMIYRREAINDALIISEATGNEELAENAKKEWAIENTALSVCMMRMINPVVSGTAFSADTATGCRGTDRKDLVSIDVSYGLGEAVVGGMVTPDKLYVFQRDDGHEVVLRTMGRKDVKIVYDEAGGTKKVDVPHREASLWALSMPQAEQIAKGVRAVSKVYDDMIMDTEFCIDAKGTLWFVQARPETRWNEELEAYPSTIFMRRYEVDPKAAAAAEVLLEGNGASRGAGQGTVRFLRSALELNKVHKGEILAAERTDPDMVPGMRVASALLADVGGDTSHAAITSRELGIPAVIGIQNATALRALDGEDITVDGTHGRVYRGLLPLHEVGAELDVTSLPATHTKVGLVLADVGQSLFLSRLRQIPNFEVGLLRAEFMLGNVAVHPAALEAFDKDELDTVVAVKLAEYERALRKTMREQLDSGLVRLDMRLREHVGQITGFSDELEGLQAQDMAGQGNDASRKRIRELELSLEKHLARAQRYANVLETSVDLAEHVSFIMGYHDTLINLGASTPANAAQRLAIETELREVTEVVTILPKVTALIKKIEAVRNDVALRSGLAKEIEETKNITADIGVLIRSRGAKTGYEHYVQTLAQGLGLFAMAFYGKPIVYRSTDFKSNEYKNLLGGKLFEADEDNPMLGYRGVSRGLHDWEMDAFKMARNAYGASNLQLMLPFVRTLEEARSMRTYLDIMHDLRSGKDGLKIILMSELPSNAILARQFIQEFDGFSIGSNDMTQMVLATDRDNASLSYIYDEEDPAVVWAILVTIFTGQKFGKKVGFCGQGVSNSAILRGLVSIVGIVAAAVVPDTFARTKHEIAEAEAENISTKKLGAWMSAQHQTKWRALMEEHGFAKDLKKTMSNEAIQAWYTKHNEMLMTKLSAEKNSGREGQARKEMTAFRHLFHKAVIYATWDWDSTIVDALHQSGFASFEEQAIALEAQRKKTW